MIRMLLLPLALATTASRADNCETIRSQIESRIAAAGVVRFSVVVIDAAATAEGKVVGSCGNGSRKIVYAAGAAASRPAAAAKPVLTECKDGSAPLHGTCKK